MAAQYCALSSEAWTQKDLLAHLTSIEGWFRKQIESAVYARPWDFESVHDFNAWAVAERHDWSLQALAHELEQEAAALQALLETLESTSSSLRSPGEGSRSGSRAPNVRLWRDGQRVSTLDLYDTHFVLLTGSSGGAWCTAGEQVAQRHRVPLRCSVVGPGVR